MMLSAEYSSRRDERGGEVYCYGVHLGKSEGDRHRGRLRSRRDLNLGSRVRVVNAGGWPFLGHMGGMNLVTDH